ncbi:DNA alkylation repair protein [bacterium]|nr:DNA alkylation repair protein [bacterium]
MPAVNPVRLRFQIEELMTFFSDPSAFHLELQGLFGLYANRTLRFGSETGIRPLIPMYHLPTPLMRQLRIDLSRLVPEDAAGALALVDELWEDEYYEVKQTSIMILSLLPMDSPEPILDRLTEWMDQDLDPMLIADIFSSGLHQLQEQFPAAWEDFINLFLQSTDPEKTALGIRGLTEGLKNPNFKNLPAVFRLVSPLIRDPEPELIRDLVNIIQVLAQHSPTETGFFLRQTLSLSESTTTQRIVKQSLAFFPSDIQADLKAAQR